MHADRTPKGRKTQDLTGQTFHYLTVTAFAGYEDGVAYWTCQCQCGSPPKNYRALTLRNGNSKSCGCYKLEKLAARKTHGGTGTKEYAIWNNMNRRCHEVTNPKYPSYGSRGIIVCERWRQDFAAFLEDMGPRPSPAHTLERKDNDGPYTPENCRWATAKEQAQNRRDNVLLTHKGKTMTVSQWARELNMDAHTLADRLRRYNWSIEEALTTPTRALNPVDIPLTYHNETRLLSEWSHILDIKASVIYERLTRSHWSVEKALSTPAQTKDARLTHDGLSLTLNEWSLRLGIPAEALRKRLRKGMSVAEALSTPHRRA